MSDFRYSGLVNPDDAYYVGVDPGQNGALVLIYPKAKEFMFWPGPKDFVGWVDSLRRVVDAEFRSFGFPIRFTVEKLHAVRGDTPKTAWVLGGHCAAIEVAMSVVKAAHRPRVSCQWIPPKIWQRVSGFRKKKFSGLEQKEALHRHRLEAAPWVAVPKYAADAALMAFADYTYESKMKRERKG